MPSMSAMRRRSASASGRHDLGWCTRQLHRLEAPSRGESADVDRPVANLFENVRTCDFVIGVSGHEPVEFNPSTPGFVLFGGQDAVERLDDLWMRQLLLHELSTFLSSTIPSSHP
jgi:hypothetical protein